VKPLVRLIARTPGALQTVLPDDVRTVLQQLEVADTEAQAAAAVASYDEPTEALSRAAYRHDVLGALTDGERQFAQTRYQDVLSNELFARDPDPLAVVLGAPTSTVDDEDDGPIPTVTTPHYGLFTHQQRAVVQTRRLLRTADTRVLLHMPTGAGKTRSAMNIVCDHLRAQSPSVVVWAASTKELLEQAAREFDKAWAHLGDRKVRVGHGWDGRTLESAEMADGFLAVTLQGLHSLLRRHPLVFDRLVDRCELMVFDEAHQAIARTYRAVTDRLAERSRLLGLSATPGRTAMGDEAADAELVAFFRDTKVMLDTRQEGHANPVHYLTEKGYLARTTFQTIHVDEPARIGENPHEDDLPSDVYTAQVVSLIRDHAPTQPRIMVFAASVAHARTVAAASTGCGVPARYVIGAMGKRARHRAIDWFKQPTAGPKVIVNYGVLSTGFDAPDVNAAIIARPTTSLVLYSQMVGRAIRGPAADGTEEALVLTVVDSDNPGFSNVATAFENWEQLWEDVT